MTDTKRIINTRRFFEKYLDRLLSVAGRNRVDLLPNNLKQLHTSPESFPTHIRYAEQLTQLVGQAISTCQDQTRKPYRRILIYSYLEEVNNYESERRLGYSSSRYGELKHLALNEFTDRFNTLVIRAGVEPAVSLINTTKSYKTCK